MIAAPPGHEESFAGAGVEVVTGGAERSDSVAAALERVDTELVAIHDAARPLLRAELVDDLLAALRGSAAAAGVIAAAPVTDTIKVAGEGLVIAETPDRRSLWAAQTPQVFRAGRLREALADGQARASATDESSLVERHGGTVLLHAAGEPNIKVTTPADLRMAEALLSDRG